MHLRVQGCFRVLCGVLLGILSGPGTRGTQRPCLWERAEPAAACNEAGKGECPFSGSLLGKSEARMYEQEGRKGHSSKAVTGVVLGYRKPGHSCRAVTWEGPRTSASVSFLQVDLVRMLGCLTLAYGESTSLSLAPNSSHS